MFSVAGTNASKRLRLVDREDYAVDLEYSKDFLIIHLPHVWKFNKGVYIDMLYTLEDFSDFFKTAGFNHLYAAVDEHNMKIRRLLVKLGFRRKAMSGNLTVYEKEL